MKIRRRKLLYLPFLISILQSTFFYTQDQGSSIMHQRWTQLLRKRGKRYEKRHISQCIKNDLLRFKQCKLFVFIHYLTVFETFLREKLKSCYVNWILQKYGSFKLWTFTPHTIFFSICQSLSYFSGQI